MDSNSHLPEGLQLVPQRCTKTIHFIRHGEGFHNIGYEQNVDAHLTPYGWHQAAALGEHIRSLRPPLNIEVGHTILHTLRCSLWERCGPIALWWSQTVVYGMTNVLHSSRIASFTSASC